MNLKSLHQCKRSIASWYEMSVYLQHWRHYVWTLGIFDSVIYYEKKNLAYIKAESRDMPLMNVEFGYRYNSIEWEFFYKDADTARVKLRDSYAKSSKNSAARDG